MINSQSDWSKAAIALGSNLGEPLSTLEKALETLDRTPGIHPIARSPWYLTKPIGPPQPDYINGCVVVRTTLAPLQLLDALLDIEAQYGRVRGERWGARTLDLDLILFDDVVMDTPRLQIPHPRMSERAFVLCPLADIALDWIDPVTQKTVAQLLEQVDRSGVRPLAVPQST